MSTDNKPTLSLRDVRRGFDRAAKSFDNADFVHEVTRTALIDRLRPMLVDARIVVDLGSATGTATRSLSRLFGRARVVPVDLSRTMLLAARKKQGWLSKRTAVQADAARLPFADGSVDVVFSNLMLPWIDDPRRAFSEVARVLRKGGLFSFATLGPDSLGQLREAWEQLDPCGQHVLQFADMHDIGDGLVRAGLADPVLDVDRLTINYTSPARLFRDLTLAGARNSLSGREKSLLGKQRFHNLCEVLQSASADGTIQIDLELVYGHCWGTGAGSRADEVRVSAGQIPVRRR